MESRVLARKGAREISRDELELVHGSNGTQFHVNTVSGGVCSGAGGGSFDCSEDRDATT